MFEIHHFTLSVRNIDEMAKFYQAFGFTGALRWSADDGTLEIAHLVNEDGFIIELFAYQSNDRLPPAELETGNNLSDVGVKHIAFKVQDLEIAYAGFRRLDNFKLGKVTQGRTGIKYFFVRDPDGNWVEVVQDDRSLVPAPPQFPAS